MEFKPGQTLRFTYLHKVVDADTGDRFKEVFVLHPRWRGKLHGIDLTRLTPAEREVLDAIMDPMAKGQVHEIPLVNDILSRMDPVRDVRNPLTFYSKFVKPFLRNKDAYRQYWPAQMINPILVKKQPRLPRSDFGQKNTPFGGPAKRGISDLPPGALEQGLAKTMEQQAEEAAQRSQSRLGMLKEAQERLKNAGLKPSHPAIPPSPPKRAEPAKPPTPAAKPTPSDRLANLKASVERLKNKTKSEAQKPGGPADRLALIRAAAERAKKGK